MTIQEFKSEIENKSIGKQGYILCSDNTFVAHQYIDEIASIYNLPIEYMHDIIEIKPRSGLFSSDDATSIKVYVTTKVSEDIELADLCYIVCTSCSVDCIQIPKIEPWHLEDFLKTNSAKNIPESYLSDLVKACKNDPWAVVSEFDKYSIFPESEQKFIFDSLRDNNQIRRTYDEDIFQFTNALLDKNLNILNKFYIDLKEYDIEPLGVVTILYRQLRKLILIGFNSNPTEENTGIPSKQIYAIKKNLYKYASKYILEAFQTVSEAEKLLKEGALSNNQLLDYIVVSLL